MSVCIDLCRFGVGLIFVVSPDPRKPQTLAKRVLLEYIN